MKTTMIACAALLAACVLGSAPVLAQDAAPAATETPSDAKPMMKVKKTSGVTSSARYKQCVKENTVVAKAYCANHSDGCEAETKAVTSECHDEASGKKFKG